MPGSPEARARQLETLIAETIAEHPNEQVAERWASMARVTAKRFPGPPAPRQPELDLGKLEMLDPEARERLVNSIERWMFVYFEDVNAQLLAMHGELMRAQVQLAELQVEQESHKTH